MSGRSAAGRKTTLPLWASLTGTIACTRCCRDRRWKNKDVYHKISAELRTVFDEFRYFKPGKALPGLWHQWGAGRHQYLRRYRHREGPAHTQSSAGAEVIININASPYEMGKPSVREKILEERSRENSVIIVYLKCSRRSGRTCL